MKFTVKRTDEQTNTPDQYLAGYVIDEHEIDGIIGKLLTLIEAVGLEDKQETSLKSIIKQTVRSGIGTHPDSFITREIIDLIYNFNSKLHEECIKSEAITPDREGGCLRDGTYELTFTSKD